MSKRDTSRARIAGDAYMTPPAAIAPLLPHILGRVRTFAEPCCGDGAILRYLDARGLKCLYAGDIAQGQDAFDSNYSKYAKPDAIITNPPYHRPLMHALIWHFMRIAPTWLLLELDWAATQQAALFMRRCSDIVVVGRVQWIPGSGSVGYDNFAWFRFAARHTGPTTFHAIRRG